MCVEGVFFFKISKRDFTFIREMRVVLVPIKLVCMCIGHGPWIYKRKANGI